MELNRLFEQVLNEVTFNKENTANSDFNLKGSVDEDKRNEASNKIREASILVEKAHEIFSKNPGTVKRIFDKENPFHKTFARFEMALWSFARRLEINEPDEDHYSTIFSDPDILDRY